MIINKKKSKSKIDSGPFAIKARDKDVSRQSALVSRRRSPAAGPHRSVSVRAQDVAVPALLVRISAALCKQLALSLSLSTSSGGARHPG